MMKLSEEHSQLRIIKVPGSKSKADNLNHFFTLDTGSDVIAVFDCDHYVSHLLRLIGDDHLVFLS